MDGTTQCAFLSFRVRLEISMCRFPQPSLSHTAMSHTRSIPLASPTRSFVGPILPSSPVSFPIFPPPPLPTFPSSKMAATAVQNSSVLPESDSVFFFKAIPAIPARRTHERVEAIIYGACGDKKVRVWTVNPVPKLVLTLEGPTSPITCIAARDGMFLAGCKDGTISSWTRDLENKHILFKSSVHTSPMKALLFMPQKNARHPVTFLSANASGTFIIWTICTSADDSDNPVGPSNVIKQNFPQPTFLIGDHAHGFFCGSATGAVAAIGFDGRCVDNVRAAHEGPITDMYVDCCILCTISGGEWRSWEINKNLEPLPYKPKRHINMMVQSNGVICMLRDNRVSAVHTDITNGVHRSEPLEVKADLGRVRDMASVDGTICVLYNDGVHIAPFVKETAPSRGNAVTAGVITSSSAAAADAVADEQPPAKRADLED